MRRSVTLRALAVCALGLALVDESASAQKAAKDKKAEAGPAAIDVKPIVQKVRSGDEAQIREALDEVRIAGTGGAAAAPAIAEALARGLSLSLTQSAIETLGELESDAGTPALAEYASHRNPKVRR